MSEQSNTVGALNSGAKKKKRRERKALSERNNKYVDNDPLGLRIQCTCNHGTRSNFKCKQISQRDVVRNRKSFYTTSGKVHQDVYLCRLISAFEPQRRGKGTPRPSGKTKLRKLSTSFFLYGKKKVMKRVCKSFFMAVFSIKRQRLSTIIKCVMDGKVPKEERGGDRRSAKSQEKKEHLRNFLRNLPCSESHYNRAKSKRVYLDAGLNIKKLRMLYNNSVTNELNVKRTMFYEVFTFEFNIGFRSPASDACSSCILLSNSIKNEKDSSKKQELMTKLRIHKLRANFFFKLLKEKVDNSITICFDLQQVFPLPRTPIQEAFYSRQISLYNLCVMDLSEQNNSCLYNWDETESGKGAISIGSALYCFLNTQTIPANVKLVRLFCDGCGGQNKNSHVLHMLLFWLQNKSPAHVKEIQLFFPVRGHSFLPADRLFGRIEKDVRKIPVITTREEYFEIFSKHGRVCELGKEWCLYDVKGLENHYKKLVGIQGMKKIIFKKCKSSQGRQLNCVVKSSPNYRFESGEQFISLLKRGKRHPRNIEQIQEERGLSLAKKNDVTSLLIKQFGADWENLSALEWYKQILSCSRNITEQNEQVDDDEACICTEMDIEDIRI
ncbi:uncharacterized protein LOC123667235 [Melitaea cinxia]|uniref:uncharacterized protein LOC123667235 n=1 Tax=Melitaea cinxia TaxID=113334 RepID=UPI001E272292|nr:uncharacterized protein LOC123667235 [Melitaea cinxia]